MNAKDTIAGAARGEGCLGRSHNDEPVFVLCARDRFSSSVVRRWADLQAAATHPDSPGRRKADEAREVAQAMDDWRNTHGGGKVPD